MSKIIMHTSICTDDITLKELLANGIKNTEVTQDNVKVVLTQPDEFFYGVATTWFDVMFETTTDKVYLDIDDGFGPDDNMDWDKIENTRDEDFLTKSCKELGFKVPEYGSFVYEVRPEDIVKVVEITSDEDLECSRTTVYEKEA